MKAPPEAAHTCLPVSLCDEHDSRLCIAPLTDHTLVLSARRPRIARTAWTALSLLKLCLVSFRARRKLRSSLYLTKRPFLSSTAA